MDVISNLGLGFAVALTLQNTAYCFIGVLLGTIIGVLPGIGPVTTVAMLLPISFTLQPESALILLAGIYYGAQYGGSTTAILVNPGRGIVGGDHHRRPPDGAAGTRRPGARHRRHRLVLRRLRLDPADRVRGAAAGGRRPAVRTGRVFLADGLRPDRGRGAGAWIAAQGDRH